MKLGSFLAVAGVAAFQGDGFVASEFNAGVQGSRV